MTYTWEAKRGRTIFVIASNFKDIAVFKPTMWRNDADPRDVDVVWYNDTGNKLLRVSGNIHRFEATVMPGKFNYKKL